MLDTLQIIRYNAGMKLDLTSEQINAVIAADYATDRRPLTPEEEEFIRIYAETLNKKRAYEKSHLDGKSDLHASTRATELLDRPEIGRRVAELMQKNLDADVAKSPNLLLKYIERYLELDPINFYNDDGTIIPLSELSPENRMLISNVSKIINNRTGDVVVTYTLPDKIKLLDHLSKLVTFVSQVRALSSDGSLNSAEAEKRRNEIFNEGRNAGSDDFTVLDEQTVLDDIAEKKKETRKRGRPKKKI